MSLAIVDERDSAALYRQFKFHAGMAWTCLMDSILYWILNKVDAVKRWYYNKVDAIKRTYRYHTSMMYRHRGLLGNRIALYGGWSFGVTQATVSLMVVSGFIN